jgi:hypothetical protein
VENVVFIIFVIMIGGVFYCLGKLFYDNDEVLEQFEPLDGVIAYQKKCIKQKDVDSSKFFQKYKIHVNSVVRFGN